MSSFDLIAIRHGRTAWNADARFQGQTDVPLDDVGREQARRLGLMLKDERIDRAFSSDLGRARETAELVLEGRRLTIVGDAGWREMQFGAWEGLTWTEIERRFPEDAADRSAAFPKPTGGETFDALTTRIGEALNRIRQLAEDGENVVVATHAGPLHALMRVALGADEARALGVRFSPATYTRIAFRERHATLVAINVAASEDVVVME